MKDAAFQVIATLLSDEVQTELSKNGKMSILANNQIQQCSARQSPNSPAKT